MRRFSGKYIIALACALSIPAFSQVKPEMLDLLVEMCLADAPSSGNICFTANEDVIPLYLLALSDNDSDAPGDAPAPADVPADLPADAPSNDNNPSEANNSNGTADAPGTETPAGANAEPSPVESAGHSLFSSNSPIGPMGPSDNTPVTGNAPSLVADTTSGAVANSVTSAVTSAVTTAIATAVASSAAATEQTGQAISPYR